MSLIAELKRRSVFKVGAAYAVVGWLVIEVAATLAPQLNLPEWAPRLITLIILLGFPVALVLAWALDLTPDGIKVARGAGNKRFYATIVVLTLAGIGWYWHATRQTSAPAGTGARTLAVLPFESLGAAADASGLAGGLQDTLITQLSKVKGLEVRSRTSTMKYKDWSGGMRTIADELGVAIILEGSVQQLGKRTVVNTQLIDARNDRHLWAETFDLVGDDLFALQSQISQRVTSELSVTLSPAEKKALSEAPTTDHEAYALYLQGVRDLNVSIMVSHAETEAARLKAAALLERAVARDPGFALAWAMLARAYGTIAWDSTSLDYRDYADKARRATAKAVMLGPDLPEAHLARGILETHVDYDFPLAMSELRAATEGMPSSAVAWSTLGISCMYSGKWQAAADAFRKSAELDPGSLPSVQSLADVLVGLRQADALRALADRVAAAHADDYWSQSLRAWTETGLDGDPEHLRAFLHGSGQRFANDWSAVVDFARVATSVADALAVLDAIPEARRPNGYHYWRGRSLLALGRTADADREFSLGRDELLPLLEAPRDPYVEALARARLAWYQAHSGDARGARENIVKAERLWGSWREPVDSGRISYVIAVVDLELGDPDDAVRRIAALADGPSRYLPGTFWIDRVLRPLHDDPRFRTIMRRNGIDVDRDPFAAPGAKAGADTSGSAQ